MIQSYYTTTAEYDFRWLLLAMGLVYQVNLRFTMQLHPFEMYLSIVHDSFFDNDNHFGAVCLRLPWQHSVRRLLESQMSGVDL